MYQPEVKITSDITMVRELSRKLPLVSVVIPVYNVEKYLEECLNTIINQTYSNIEVIVVNDGSTDSSGVIAEKFLTIDSRLTVIHKVNGGLSDARNAGMSIATGKYITFIDSDDYVDYHFVETLTELAEKINADIVQSNNSRDPSRLGTGSKKYSVMHGNEAFVKLMKYKTISPTAWAKLYKLSIFSNNDLKFPVGRLHEDTALLYKLIYHANKIIHLDRTLYYYRINNESIMCANYTERHYSSVVTYHAELDDFISSKSIPVSRRIIQKHKALRFLSILNKMALHDSDKSTAYMGIRNEYVKFSLRSRSVVSILGTIPAYFPAIFRTIRSTTPIVRKMLGKT